MNLPNQIAASEDFEFAALSEAKNYRRAIVNEFSDFLKGRVLEIGAGIGQITEEILLIKKINKVVGLEPDLRFQQEFRTRLPHIRLVAGTILDMDHDESFDAAIMVNVLEHIEHDQEELVRLYRVLKPVQGHLCLLVPARKEIYSDIDAHFGHYRRYDREELQQKLNSAGFKIKKIYYFNLIGYFAWMIRFKLMKKKNFDIRQITLFDRLIFPFFYRLESSIIRPPIGQSLIAVAQAL